MSIDYRNDNTIVFTLARMNPPTPGHLYLIQRLIEEGINKNVNKVYVILSKTNDNNENPIPCSEKISVLGTAEDITKTMVKAIKEQMISKENDEDMKKKINDIDVESICVPEVPRATPFTPLYNIIGEKHDIPDLNLFIVIGDDRKNMRDSVTDFFFKWDNVNSVDGLILDRPNMGKFKSISSNPTELATLNMSEVPSGALSASFVRNLVKYNMRDKFIELYSPYLDESKIPVLYEEILEGLSLPPNTKKETVPKDKGYRYPMIKGISTSSSERITKKPRTIGGKKTKRKQRKTRKTRKNNKRQTKRNR
jgi:hypothetical protein